MKASKISIALLAAMTAVSLAAATPAHAQLVLSGHGCNTGGAIALMGALGCRGAYVGNDANQQADVLQVIQADAGVPYVWLGKSDDANNGPFTSNPGGTSGMLTFDSPITGFFVLSLKAGNFFSLYGFNGTNTSSVSFTTIGVGVNANGGPLGLSHASLYVPATVVPEPSTYVLMATGLLAMGLIRRRRA
jgi:hypothetical protein